MIVRLLMTLAVGVVLACSPIGAQQDELAALLGHCKADAAERADAELAEVQVVRVEAVTWSDGSLGCPKPGLDYVQMLVPGYRVTLRVAEKEYEYHTDKITRFVYCEGGGNEPAEIQGPVALSETQQRPEEPRIGVLHLEAILDEPNLNSRLVFTDTSGEKTTVIPECTEFGTSRNGWVLAKKRTSRSTHELLLARVGQEPRTIMGAFDFAALTFSLTDDRYALLVRQAAGAPFRIYLGSPDTSPRCLEWAPSPPASPPVRLRLAGDILLLTEMGSDDDVPKTTILNLHEERACGALQSPRVELLITVQETPAATAPTAP